MKAIDLHVHSNRSDGTFSPKELVDYAVQKELAAIALTDHDTIDGLDEIITYAETLRNVNASIPEIIPGIEFSAAENTETHIIGLFIDPENETLLKTI